MALMWTKNVGFDQWYVRVGRIDLDTDERSGIWYWRINGHEQGTAPTREAAQRAAEDAARRLLKQWLSELGDK